MTLDCTVLQKYDSRSCRYALPTRQRFLVSADAVPFKGVRTRPIQPPSEVDDEAMGVKSKSVVAAALVPTGVVHGLASSDSLPAFPGNTVKAKTVPKQIPPPSRLGKRQPGIKFGLEVAPLSRPGTGVDGIAAPVGGSEMDIPLFYQSSLSTSQPSALQLPDEPIEVDKDGVYTVPVPGVGRFVCCALSRCCARFTGS